ncbi:aldehyde dehydrogenase family protein [Paraburkholderia caledonica]|uniref:Acyl-CoA reductase-like NAD-dependent aldehyde dehydrogenase n=1 Tax=Paraburkholderia caledonica TaxID=134536 RepID=A0AB73IM61_9BURK|nr:acyl-CoA reductase-like NAD-dependent aldehyde dehydrogenase [Paraburkholderia caledonica]
MSAQQSTMHGAVHRAAELAHAAAPMWGRSRAQARAALLTGLAEALEANAAALVDLANAETGLGAARLNGEIARTAFQLQGFLRRKSGQACHIARSTIPPLRAPRRPVVRI